MYGYTYKVSTMQLLKDVSKPPVFKRIDAVFMVYLNLSITRLAM